MGNVKYPRVLLKISGEALAGPQRFGIDPQKIGEFSTEIAEVISEGVQLALVVGGGNIFRGVSQASKGMDRASADYMGMLATVINCLAFQDALEKKGVRTRVMSAIVMREIAEPYIRGKAISHLEKNRLVIFAAGTGNPYFSTDTAAALRANEIKANALFKATKVNGIYNKDPHLHPDAELFRSISYQKALEMRLKVMDSTALSLSMDNNMPLLVFNLFERGNIRKAIMGEEVGTIVQGG